jgi:hypothetical protein
MSQFKKYLEIVQENNYNEGIFKDAKNAIVNLKNKITGNKPKQEQSFELDSNDANRIEKMKSNYKNFYDNFINKLKGSEKTSEIYNKNKTNPTMFASELIANKLLSENDYEKVREIFNSKGNLEYMLKYLFPNEYLKKTSTASLVTKLNDIIKTIHMPKFGTEIEKYSLTKDTSI